VGSKAGPTVGGGTKTLMLALTQNLYFIVNRIHNFCFNFYLYFIQTLPDLHSAYNAEGPAQVGIQLYVYIYTGAKVK
jgi:hypothetical protein